ncbi:hypothetical protein [Mucilaginibacter dorajii]|uniref:Uncharacterized protein n=1 Tax=Mucilaginibacter dorajii TaxID=692994 RepID=A0ABP7P088_9SPHI|nr:hypothetical protein [Mucilaginibacter dorajii]MCS3735603.1 hypothetical protein [Mucilaginibacter dorajii]
MKPKQTLLLLLVLITTLPLSSFKNRAGDKGVYGFVYVSGTFTDSKHALISRIIYEPPYPDCKDNSFWSHAQSAFGKYLTAYYDNETYSSSSQVVQSKHQNSSRSYLSQKQAQDAMDELVTQEKADGHEVKFTNFAYSCE